MGYKCNNRNNYHNLNITEFSSLTQEFQTASLTNWNLHVAIPACQNNGHIQVTEMHIILKAEIINKKIIIIKCSTSSFSPLQCSSGHWMV